ncbi:hypothetical protein [Pedobacter nanyangensis]|uniref:hypothetical protein n=1 Tax=Pedobacter nanyangensis TaxID=1562389 RepID=UPI000DE3CA34|nr:hypothetical protein [Pedobacter nanyangensis]
MKTNRFLIAVMLFAGAIIFIAGCKKESPISEEEKAVQMIQEKMLGRWNLIEFIEETKKGNEPPVIIDNDPKNVYFEFFANGRGKTNAEGEEEFSYEVKPNILVLWGAEQAIIELTDNKFTFKNTVTLSGVTYTQTYYLTR